MVKGAWVSVEASVKRKILAGVGIEVLKIIKIGTGILLLLIGALVVLW